MYGVFSGSSVTNMDDGVAGLRVRQGLGKTSGSGEEGKQVLKAVFAGSLATARGNALHRTSHGE